MDLSALILAGTTLAEGLLKDDAREEQFGFDREMNILKLQDNERSRANDLARSELMAGASVEAAKLQAGAALEQTKRKILGDMLLKQGDGQLQGLLTKLKGTVSRPERFNDAASILSQVLAR